MAWSLAPHFPRRGSKGVCLKHMLSPVSEEPLLLAELKPGRSHQFDWKSSCETWSVAFSPDGSWFAWSQGHCIVKLIPWPLEEQL